MQLHEDGDSSSGRLSLYAEVGPLSNYEFRKGLIERIDTISKDSGTKLVGFSEKGLTELGEEYSKFLKSNVVQIGDSAKHRRDGKGNQYPHETLYPRF
ncbi:hypothetical protein [Rhizobium binxianense]